MKRKQYSVEQIVAALKQAELGMSVADLVRQLGISEQTYYRWNKQYAGLESNQVRELKQLQDENERLKKLAAELSLDQAILQDIAPKKGGRVRAAEAGSELHHGSLRSSDTAGVPTGHASSQYPLLSQHQGSADGTASTHA
ncbi:transposase [Burkholderia lata]|nr:transposase [Burkholderia lata]